MGGFTDEIKLQNYTEKGIGLCVFPRQGGTMGKRIEHVKRMGIAGLVMLSMLFLTACGGRDTAWTFPTAAVSESAVTPKVSPGPISLHVATYNIQHGAMVDCDYSLIGQKIAELEIGVIGLQEVDQKTERIGGRDALQELSMASGCPFYAFAKALDLLGGEYGVAILSRYEIVSFETVLLYSEGTEQRVLGHAVLRVGTELIDFFVTHLTFGRNTDIRKRQLEDIAQELAKTEEYLITGDFNTSDYQEFEIFPGATPLNCFERYFETFYTYHLGSDNIILSSGWSGDAVQMETFQYSDHYMLHAMVTQQ